MASITQIRQLVGPGIDCIASGGGASDAGLTPLPFPYIWQYDSNTKLPCSDKRAWLPAVDIVRIQAEQSPSLGEGLLQDLIASAKLGLGTFITGNPLSFVTGAIKAVEKAEAAQESASSFVTKAEAASERIQHKFIEEARPMAFDDFGFGGIFDSVVDFGSQLIDEVDFSQVLNLGTGLATQLFAPQGQPLAMNVAASGSAARAAAGVLATRTGAVVGRSFFTRFPNLATAIQRLRNAGQNVKRSQLYTMMKRFGPEFLISAGILSAAAVNELMIAGPGRRHMNPTNVKALRRSMRRLKSFHNLCQDVDTLRARRRSSGGRSKSCGDSRVIVAK